MARLLSERPETSSNRSSTTSATSTNVKKMGDDETSLKNTWNINNEGPGSSNSLNTNFNNNKSIVTSRKLSFKLRNANTSTSSRPTFRATRVTISSNNVTALASKFNAVVIENNAQGRALLKKLNGGNHVPIKKPSKPVEGKVRAAVQHFETNRSNNYSEHRPKFVLVRKHSSNKYTNNNNRKSIAQSLNNKLDNVTEIEQDETKTLTASYQESEVKTKPKKKPNQRSIKTNLPQNPFSANPCFTTSTSINNSSESKFEIGNKNTDDKTDNDINKNSTETDLKSNNDDTFVVKCDSSTEVKEKDHHDKQNGIPIKYRIKDKKNNNNNNNNAVTKSKGKFRTCVLSSTGFYCVGDYETDDIDGSKGDKNYKATCIMQIGNDDNHVIIEEGYSKRQSSNNNSDTTVLMKNNKPKLQPKPNVIEINNVDLTKKKSSSSTSSSTSSLSKDCISEIKVDSLLHQDKKLSLAKDQSNLESALNEISLNTNINEESKTIKNTSVKPNRSFLWRNITSNKIEIKDIVKDIKDKESLIIAGVKHNVEAKLTNDSRLFQENNKKGDSLNGNDNDKQPTYMNGSVVCNLQHQKEFKNDESVKKEKCTTLTRNVSVNNNRKSSLYNCILQNSNDLQNDSTDGGLLNANKFRSTSSLTSFKKDQNIEEKENVLKRISLPSSTSPAINSTNTSTKIIYEEFENTLNNSVTSGSFLYKNIYITEARNEDILPIGAKNESVTVLNNYEEIQQNNSVTLTQALPYSPSYVESSKSSYGYVDPGNYEDLEDNYASINDNYDVNRENIYDDVINVKKDIQILINKETSGSSCGNELSHYESVYQTESCSAFEKDSDSSCDQSNSLYGITGCRPSSRSSSVSYHITGHGQPTPRSETSDEWVDVDNSGDEEILVYTERDRTRGRNVNGTGWCQKVRREWSKRANRSDGSDSDSNDHQYESVQGQTAQPIVCDDFDGSFDSDSSFDDDDRLSKSNRSKLQESYCDRTLPSVPQNDGIYGLMKQAGRRMRKHWSIGKSLRRIRKMSSGTLVHSSSTDEQADSTNGSNLNRRRWSSFKSKFKTSSNSGSTFYLDSDQLSLQKQDTIENCDKISTISSSTAITTTTTSTNQSSVPVDPRRFSVSSLRPTSPPPPPPTFIHKNPLNISNVSEENAPKRPPRSGNSSASWYSETEAFETSTNGSSENSFNRSNNSAWYTDSGLWDGSQTVTPDSGSENSSSHGSDLHLRFADEPLYQFYNATVTEKELNLCYSTTDKDNTGEPLDSDGYEEIGDHLISRPSAMELITPKYGHHRTLWCEIPQVLNSEILRTLTKEERKLQEAKFEVMTSEASYFKSLIVLEKHFAASPLLQDESVLSAKDRKSLFGCITPVRKCSEKLLSSLDKCWQESIMLAGICDIIHRHAIHYFQVYISYCSNQIDLNATLKKLKETNKKFEDTLAHLEADPKCESLSLHSFLMLPMQRITRMPLLVDAILSKLEISHPEYSSCQFALKTLNEFVQRCNEETRQQERVIEMMKLSSQLDFSKDVRTLPIVSKNRWLVRSGQVIQLNLDTRQTFGRRFTKSGSKITLFLFNDVLLLAKRKSNEDGYVVIDHCQKNLIQMNEEDDVVNNSSRYLIKLAMLKNHEGRLVEMFLSCDSETCRQRWMQAVAPPTSEIPGESIYESWDCPQVVGIHSYISVQPDELSLQKGDIINVLRKMTDGWYYGERTRDGEKGWFPGNHVHEIISSHVRARNLRQRYRLLVLSGSYLLEQQNNRKSVK
ncbi:uncharacterized protein LOC142334073 isoform X2 [Lycorma delicatula]|uniref:uncharacterized protein LOC142334073 isoform X2 n=1 Tax=Lycorma delicatula TaxID=130591 RepID=UPI003F51266D